MYGEPEWRELALEGLARMRGPPPPRACISSAISRPVRGDMGFLRNLFWVIVMSAFFRRRATAS